MKLNASARRKTVAAVAVVLAAIVCSTTTAHAIPLFKFVGIVTDALNRPMANVKVTDGTNAPVYTGADGRYSLQEESLTTYTLQASRSDTLTRSSERQTVTLPLDRTVDFTPPDKHLLYRLSATPSPATISTAVSGGTINLNITSWAPQPATTCVNVRDTRTGLIGSATYLQMIDSVRSSWRYTLSIPQAAAQGSFSLVTDVTDCATATPLTSTFSAYYTVDNTAPTINRTTLLPGEEGNTILTSQRVQFTLNDTLSGVNASSITAVVTDRNSGQQWTPTRTTTSVGGGVTVLTAPVPLQSGGQYSVTATGRDYAGNAMSFTWNFRHLAFTIESAKAIVEGTAGTATGENNNWTFMPYLEIGHFDVTAPPTQHNGYGSIAQTVPLQGAYIEYSLLGVESPLRQENIYPQGKTVNVYKPFMKAASEPATTIEISSQQVHLEPITVQLPPFVTAATLKLPEVDSNPRHAAEVCPPGGCNNPDPLPIHLPDGLVDDILDLRASEGQEEMLGEVPAIMTSLVPETIAEPEHHWQPLSGDSGVVYLTVDDEVIGFLEGVSYSNNINFFPLSSSAHTASSDSPCLPAGDYPCTHEEAFRYSTEELRYKCLRIDGRDASRTSEEDCRQFNALVDIRAAKPLYYDNQFRFSVASVSQLGYADNRASIDERNEALGIAWNDEGGWEWVNPNGNAWRMAKYDVYYCNGDEWQAGERGEGRHYHFAEMAGSSGTDVQFSGLSPYGIEYPHDAERGAKQWRNSSDFVNIDEYTWCRSFYAQDDPYRMHTHPIARAKVFYIDASFRTSRTQFDGTAVGSVGHVWKRWEWDWALEVGFECGSTCNVGFGYQFKPYQKNKHEQFGYAWGYHYPE